MLLVCANFACAGSHPLHSCLGCDVCPRKCTSEVVLGKPTSAKMPSEASDLGRTQAAAHLDAVAHRQAACRGVHLAPIKACLLLLPSRSCSSSAGSGQGSCQHLHLKVQRCHEFRLPPLKTWTTCSTRAAMSRISCICSVGKAQALANAPSHPELGVTQPSSDLWLYKTSNGSSGEGHTGTSASQRPKHQQSLSQPACS